MYRTNWSIGHSMKEILEGHKGPLTGEGHKGLYEIFVYPADGTTLVTQENCVKMLTHKSLSSRLNIRFSDS